VLERLLALDRLADVAELFLPDEGMHTVFAGEGQGFACAVLLNTPYQPVGHTDVERAPRLAGQDVGSVAVHGAAPVECRE
jgi:hypothetical protein